MLIPSLILCVMVPFGSRLKSFVRSQSSEPDQDSILHKYTLLEQSVQDMKKQMSVVESELNRVTAELATCTTDMAVVKSQVHTLQFVKDTYVHTFDNLTTSERLLRDEVTKLNNALADVYVKSMSNLNFINIMHGVLDLVKIDDWVLAFRAQAGIGVPVYDTWMDDAIFHDNPLLPWLVGPECQSLQTSQPCRVHFKSRIVPLWKTVNIQQVKILLIKDSQVRHEILFDGVGTTKTNWFSHDRVINSTWTDLKKAPVNLFSIKG